MSSRYPSGFIKASSPQPTSGVSLYGSAKGFWSLMAVSRNMSKSSRQWPDSRNSYPAGQSAYTSPGTYSWVCPANITSVSAVAIGGGGGRTGNLGYISAGGGGGLGWKNSISVTPGSSYTVDVGRGGYNGNTTTTGGESNFVSSGTVRGRGGSGGCYGSSGCSGGSFTGDGGGNGGTSSSGGGGAGGYSGSTGGGYRGTNISGDRVGGGGGTGIYGQGSSGSTYSEGGSGGNNAGTSGGWPGGGAGGNGNGYNYSGAHGAVRIIWAGEEERGSVALPTGGRAFPSTNTGDL